MKNMCNLLKTSFIVLSLSVFFGACQKQERVDLLFDEDATARINGKLTELEQELRGSETGWMVRYEPWKGRTSKFALYLNFKSDFEVESVSDLEIDGNEQKIYESEYEVKLGTTTKLVFNTYTPAVHKFSDNYVVGAIEGELGVGFGGSVAFLYYGKTEDGRLLFRNNRRLDTLYFEPNTIADPADFMKKNVEKLNEIKNNLEVGFPVIQVFDKGGFESGEEPISRSRVNINSLNRNVKYGRAGLNSKGENVIIDQYTDYMSVFGDLLELQSLKIGIDKTLDNIVFKISEAIVNESGRVVYLAKHTTKDGEEYDIRLFGSLDPVIVIKDHKKLFANENMRVTYFVNDADMPSLYKSDVFAGIIKVLVEEGVVTNDMSLYINSFDRSAFWFTGPVYNQFTPEDKESYILFKDVEHVRALTPAQAAAYQLFSDIMYSKEGWIVENLGAATRYSNTIYLFISRKNPKIFFAGYFRGI